MFVYLLRRRKRRRLALHHIPDKHLIIVDGLSEEPSSLKAAPGSDALRASARSSPGPSVHRSGFAAAAETTLGNSGVTLPRKRGGNNSCIKTQTNAVKYLQKFRFNQLPPLWKAFILVGVDD